MIDISTASKEEPLSDSDSLDLSQPFQKRKILLLGGQEVGKTSIIKRYKNNIFIDEYEPTIQSITKKKTTINDEAIELEIVDFDGQTEYTIFSPNKFSFGFNGYLLVYNIKDRKSFELIKYIFDQINNISGRNISKILVGTKSDNDIVNYERQVSYSEGKKFAEKIHCPFIEVSSKDNKNVDEAFRLLLFEINKTESGVSLKKLKFFKVFEFFIHHENCMTILFYALLLLCVVLGIFSILMGVGSEILTAQKAKNTFYFYGIGFYFIFFGVWISIFCICEIFGLKSKNIFMLDLSYLALLCGNIFLIVTSVNYLIIQLTYFKESDQTVFQEIRDYFLYCSIAALSTSVIFSKIFLVIHQQELQCYMA